MFSSPLPEEVLLYAGAAGLALSLVALALVLILYRRLSRLMLGRSGASLEETVSILVARTNDFASFRKELETYLHEADIRIARSIQGVATVRFNPFRGDGSGGNQSFATALLDEKGTGVVISTLYARDRVSVFCKPVAEGHSSYELSDEERDAITKAAVH